MKQREGDMTQEWHVPLAAERRRLRRERPAPHLPPAVRDLLVDVINLDSYNDEAPSLTEMAKRARALLGKPRKR